VTIVKVVIKITVWYALKIGIFIKENVKNSALVITILIKENALSVQKIVKNVIKKDVYSVQKIHFWKDMFVFMNANLDFLGKIVYAYNVLKVAKLAMI
jgi:hypothetical protein